jgi:hypothetical protein
MSNRFHNKFHRHNHHTAPTDRDGLYPDSAYDPIASRESPFQGEFYSVDQITTTDSVLVGQTLSATNGRFTQNVRIDNFLTVFNDISAARNIVVDKDVWISGNLTVLGETTQLDTLVYATSALSVVNSGTGPAVFVKQTGNQPVAQFFDDDIPALVIDGRDVAPGYVGINTLTPNEQLTVVGNISGINPRVSFNNAFAQGIESFAVNTGKALGSYSFAEGDLTVSQGLASHSEGLESSAIGNITHAEGLNSYAFGDISHTEGAFNYSLDIYTHSEGLQTVAAGAISHTEGYLTATGRRVNFETFSKDFNLFTFNSANSGAFQSLTPNTRLIAFIDNVLYDFIVASRNTINGSISAVSTSIPNNVSSGTRYLLTREGIFAHAEGYQTQAYGFNSHAQGNNSIASGFTSHAQGYQTQALGFASHAQGNTTLAIGNESHTQNYQTSATNFASHAEGNKTIASGFVSHAEGSFSKASGNESHAEGYSTNATNFASHAEGDGTTASGTRSHAEGYGTLATGANSHAEGQFTSSSGNASHAEGNLTTASGSNSHAEGSTTTASGGSSHAEGIQTIASGLYSHAQGSTTTASGNTSNAEGTNTRARGSISHSSGFYSEAVHDRTWIWKGSTSLEHLSTTKSDQFMVSAANGSVFYGQVGIGTDNPASRVHINATDAIIIPVGNTSQRVNVKGAIRYNSQLSAFEGYGENVWGTLGGVRDTDQDTYIIAEDSPGADNDQLKFFTVNQQRMIVDSNGNVGIGTTSPPNEMLTVTNNISAKNLVFAKELAFGSLERPSLTGIKAALDSFLYVPVGLNFLRINGSSSQTLEVGQSLVNPTITWNSNKVEPQAITEYRLTLPTGVQQTGSFTFTSYNDNQTYNILQLPGTNTQQTSSWNVRVTDWANNQFTGTTSANWLYRVYFGTTTQVTPNNSNVLANIETSQLATGRLGLGSKTLTPSNEYFYIAYPTRFGLTSTLTVNGLNFNAFTVSTITNFTNSYGGTADYYVLRSNNLLAGTYIVQII